MYPIAFRTFPEQVTPRIKYAPSDVLRYKQQQRDPVVVFIVEEGGRGGRQAGRQGRARLLFF
jgi:hypothetical protein